MLVSVHIAGKILWKMVFGLFNILNRNVVNISNIFIE